MVVVLKIERNEIFIKIVIESFLKKLRFFCWKIIESR